MSLYLPSIPLLLLPHSPYLSVPILSYPLISYLFTISFFHVTYTLSISFILFLHFIPFTFRIPPPIFFVNFLPLFFFLFLFISFFFFLFFFLTLSLSLFPWSISLYFILLSFLYPCPSSTFPVCFFYPFPFSLYFSTLISYFYMCFQVINIYFFSNPSPYPINFDRSLNSLCFHSPFFILIFRSYFLYFYCPSRSMHSFPFPYSSHWSLLHSFNSYLC